MTVGQFFEEVAEDTRIRHEKRAQEKLLKQEMEQELLNKVKM